MFKRKKKQSSDEVGHLPLFVTQSARAKSAMHKADSKEQAYCAGINKMHEFLKCAVVDAVVGNASAV